MDPQWNLVRGNTTLDLIAFFRSYGRPTAEAEPMVDVRLLVSRSQIHQPGRIVQVESEPTVFSFVVPLSDLFPHRRRGIQVERMLSHVSHPHRGDINFWKDQISSYAFQAANVMVLEGYRGFLMEVYLNISTEVNPHYWPSILNNATMVDEILMYTLEGESAGRDFGAARASESSIKALERKTYRGDGKDGATCSICLENFQDGVGLIMMPCSHDFHRSCAIKWLKRSHFCPLCRYPMPTVDEDQGTSLL